MKQGVEVRIVESVQAWVGFVQIHAGKTTATVAVLTLVLAAFTALTLGVNMDNKRLLSPDLPFQKAARAYGRYFPTLDDTLLIVVDAEGAEQARTAALALAHEIGKRSEIFSDVFVPGGDSFFQRHGLLYRSLDELDELVDHVAVMQPVLADLHRDPSIGSLSRLIRLGLDRTRKNAQDPAGAKDPETDWRPVLDMIGQATVRVFDEYPLSISWEDLMVEGTALDPGKRRVIIAEPVLDFDKLLAAEGALDVIRASADKLGFGGDSDVRVRVTGNPALNYEEMLGLAWDIGVSTTFSMILVVGLLYLALRSMRLVFVAAMTLITGLIWTAAFASVAVGKLNLLSIAFAVLFVGLGADFAIHLGMRYVEALRQRGSQDADGDAIDTALHHTAGALVLCALTTAIGFLAFYPTGYRGVAELGLISGAGMFIILLLTFTLFPALIALLINDRPDTLKPALNAHLTPPEIFSTYAGSTVAVAIALGVAAATQIPSLQFDINVVDMRDPGTESVQAFHDLLERSDTSPWHIDILSKGLEDANETARRIRSLEPVEAAFTFADYIPAEQETKQEILETAAMLLEVPAGEPPVAPSTDQQIEALRDLRNQLDAAWLQSDTPLARSAATLRDHLDDFLSKIRAGGQADKALDNLQSILLGNFRRQFDRLRDAVSPPAVTRDNLPDQLRRRMISEDGHARIQIFPRQKLDTSEEVARFVDAVRDIDPSATGVPVNLLELGRATSEALRQAITLAFISISILLLALWRRIADTMLVLAPLVLGAVLTCGLMACLGVDLNFTNVVVLPLLIGIGVDSGIHIVHTARSGMTNAQLRGSVAMRAVFFSALTTMVSFGSLSLSAHRGISTLGIILVCGVTIILASNLIVLPALLALHARWTDH